MAYTFFHNALRIGLAVLSSPIVCARAAPRQAARLGPREQRLHPPGARGAVRHNETKGDRLNGSLDLEIAAIIANGAMQSVISAAAGL